MLHSFAVLAQREQNHHHHCERVVGGSLCKGRTVEGMYLFVSMAVSQKDMLLSCTLHVRTLVITQIDSQLWFACLLGTFESVKEPIYLYLFFESYKTMRWKSILSNMKYLLRMAIFGKHRIRFTWKVISHMNLCKVRKIQLESHEWIASHIQLMFGQQPSGF